MERVADHHAFPPVFSPALRVFGAWESKAAQLISHFLGAFDVRGQLRYLHFPALQFHLVCGHRLARTDRRSRRRIRAWISRSQARIRGRSRCCGARRRRRAEGEMKISRLLRILWPGSRARRTLALPTRGTCTARCRSTHAVVGGVLGVVGIVVCALIGRNDIDH